MILGLPGTVLGQPETVEQFGLTLADRGLLISTLFAGLLFGSLLSGPLVDAMGQRAALILSSSLVAMCLPLFAMASSAARRGVRAVRAWAWRRPASTPRRTRCRQSSFPTSAAVA